MEPAAAKTASVAGSWYEQAEPNEMAETQVPREQFEQDRVATTAGTLQPKPITTRTRSCPPKPKGLSHRCNLEESWSISPELL